MSPDLLNRIAMWGSIAIVSVMTIAVVTNVLGDSTDSAESLSTSTLQTTVTAPPSGDIPIRRGTAASTTTTVGVATMPSVTSTTLVGAIPSEPDDRSDPSPDAPSTTTAATTTTQPPATTAPSTTSTTVASTTTSTTDPSATTTTSTTTIPETTTTTVAPPPPTPDPASLFLTRFTGRSIEEDDGWIAGLSIRLGSTDSESRAAAVTVTWTGAATGSQVIATGSNGRATATIGPLPSGTVTFTITNITADDRIYAPDRNTASTSLILEGAAD